MWLKKKYFNLKGDFLHIGFEAGIILKGIDGILEILGGFLFILINPAKLNRIVALLTQHELSEDPNDLIANFLVKTVKNFSVKTQYFVTIYLLLHGTLKLFLISMILQKKYWAYPLIIVFLSLFIIYQLYRYSIDHSLWLLLLTTFDFALVILTWIEYKKIGAHQKII